MSFGEWVAAVLRLAFIVPATVIMLRGMFESEKRIMANKVYSEWFKKAQAVLLALACLGSLGFYDYGIATVKGRERAYSNGKEMGNFYATLELAPTNDLHSLYLEDDIFTGDRYFRYFVNGYMDGYYDASVNLGNMKKLD